VTSSPRIHLSGKGWFRAYLHCLKGIDLSTGEVQRMYRCLDLTTVHKDWEYINRQDGRRESKRHKITPFVWKQRGDGSKTSRKL